LASVAVVLLSLLVGVSAPPPAGAQSEADRKSEIESQIEALKNQVSEASAEEAKLIREIDASLTTKRALDAKVATLDGEIAGVQRNLSASLNKLAAAQAEQRAAEARRGQAGDEPAEQERTDDVDHERGPRPVRRRRRERDREPGAGDGAECAADEHGGERPPVRHRGPVLGAGPAAGGPPSRRA
jgi:septal ring factor EnvC (AmiA/AmiB activator)